MVFKFILKIMPSYNRYVKYKKDLKYLSDYVNLIDKYYNDYNSAKNILFRNQILKSTSQCIDDYCGRLFVISERAAKENDLFMVFEVIRVGLKRLELNNKSKFIKSSSYFLKLYDHYLLLINLDIPKVLKSINVQFNSISLAEDNNFTQESVVTILNFLADYTDIIKQINSGYTYDNIGLKNRFVHIQFIIKRLRYEFEKILYGFQSDLNVLKGFFVCHASSKGFPSEILILKTRFKLNNKTPTFAINTTVYTYEHIYFIGSLADFIKEAMERNFILKLVKNDLSEKYLHLNAYKLFMDENSFTYLNYEDVYKVLNDNWWVIIYDSNSDKTRLKSSLVAVTNIFKEKMEILLNENKIKPQYKIYYINPTHNMYDTLRYLMQTADGKKILYNLLF